MSGIAFRVEREEAPGVRHPALAKSWARVEISVGSECVTTVFDPRTGSTRRGVYAPAILIAQWVVQNFWFLLHECAPSSCPSPAWLRRHSLAAAREGMALPDLRCFRDEDEVLVQWRASPSETLLPRVRFVESGQARLTPRQVEHDLSQFVDAVLEQVRDLEHVDVAALRADWDASASAGGDDAVLCKHAARLGLDAFDEQDVTDSLAHLVVNEVCRLPEATRDDLLDAVKPSQLATTLAAVSASVSPLERTAGLVGGVAPVALEALPGHPEPYEHGYAVARALRKQFPANGDEALDIDSALRGMGWHGFHQADDAWEPVAPEVKAAVGVTPAGVPRVTSKPFLRPANARFLLARSVYFLLANSTSSAPRLVTTAGTRLQAASRAFAAEWLAPAMAISRRIKDGVDDERIQEIAEDLGVSATVIAHQIENHGLRPC